MVGDDAQGFVIQIGCASHFRHGSDQIAEQVDLIVRVNVLQHGRNTLQAHTGVHGRLRQRLHGAIGLAVELHKDDVPDLNVAIAVFVRAARRTAGDMRAVVEEDLGTGAARTGVAHLPEVIRSVGGAFVITNADDTFARDANLFFPDFVSFVVGFVDGYPQAIFRQVEPVFTGQQFPCVLDSIVFEIVAKAEVTQHFKEGVMARGVTDVFQIVVFTARTHAALRGGCAGIITLVETKENILELVHPGVGKQQSWIVVGYQGAACNNLMTFTMEKIEKRLTDLSGALAHNYPEIKLTKCRSWRFSLLQATTSYWKKWE